MLERIERRKIPRSISPWFDVEAANMSMAGSLV